MSHHHPHSASSELQKWLYLISQEDREALRYLLQALWKKVYALALATVDSPAAAEEITAAVFYAIWSDRQELNAIENFSVYLFDLSRQAITAKLLQINRAHDQNPATEFDESKGAAQWQQEIHTATGDGTIQKNIEAAVFALIGENDNPASAEQPMLVQHFVVIAVIIVLAAALIYWMVKR